MGQKNKKNIWFSIVDCCKTKDWLFDEDVPGESSVTAQIYLDKLWEDTPQWALTGSLCLDENTPPVAD